MLVYRICRAKYARDLSGSGAEKAGGRWNSKGIPMLYASGSIALATTELAVHLPLGQLPSDFELISIEIPDEEIKSIDLKNLPTDWQNFPHSASTQALGDAFAIKSKHLVLRVPSAVIPQEFNYLISPRHPKFKALRITAVKPFSFDKRLFVR